MNITDYFKEQRRRERALRRKEYWRKNHLEIVSLIFSGLSVLASLASLAVSFLAFLAANSVC